MKQSTLKRASRVAILSGLALLPVAPAHAQIAQLTSAMNWLQVTLASVAVIFTVLSIMFVAFKMLAQKSRLEDIMHIIIGGVLLSAAPAIGAIIVGGTGS